MPQRVFCFVVVLILFFKGEIFSQQKQPVSASDTPRFYRFSFIQSEYNFLSPGCGTLPEEMKPKYFSLQPVPPDFYAGILSFFCKKELQIEKATSVPFRFRIGSLDYVNYLEQKPNSLKPR